MTAMHELDLFATPLVGVSLIEASAGTGKTWTLTGLYVRLIVEQAYRVEQILVVTYTKAATAELRERVRRRLADVLRSLATGEPADLFCQTLLERVIAANQPELAMRRLQTAIRNFDEAAIFTIHGFCQRVLTESAFESGMAFETELTTDESSFVRETVDDFWRRETAGAAQPWARYLTNNGQTPDAWRLTVRPYLGKPYLEIAPIPDLGDVDRMEQTFSDAFARSQCIWLDRRTEITDMILDSANAKILKNNTYRPDALPEWFASIDDYFSETDANLPLPEKLAKLSQEALETGTAKNKTLPTHPFFNACSALAEAAEALAEQYRLRLLGLQIRLIEECNAELPRIKSKLGLMSYDDLLNRLAEALDSADGKLLAAVIRNRYRAALIDEFQDTDPVQYRIFRAIYATGDRPVFYVGDPKQAIYAFRGADVFSYLEARNQAASQYTLGVNQRSAPNLIAAMNTLFQHSPNPFLLREIDFRPVQAAQHDRAKLWVEGDSSEPFRFELMPLGEKPVNKETANELAALATATAIVRVLNQALDGKAQLVGSQANRPLNGGDIAVLVPTHRQGALIQDALAQRGVPSVRQGQDTIFSSKEAVELERILTGIIEPQRESHIRSALATELAGLDATRLFGLQNDEMAWEKIVYAFTRYREIWVTRGFMPMFRRWLEENGVVERLLSYPDGERRLTNLLHLAELLQVESRGKPGPDRLLGWFSRSLREPEGDDEALLRLESDAERVKIVTIHTSKGLEYPIVFCPFLWDGNLWKKDEMTAIFHDPDRDYQPVLDLGGVDYATHRELASREKLAEKLRLLYVALTRAKHRCQVIWGLVSGMETSALAWLLHGPAEFSDDPLTSLAERCKALDGVAIEMALRDLASQAPGSIAVEPLQIDQRLYTPTMATEQPLVLSNFNRPYLRPTWRMASFSALARGRHSEGPDYDPAEPESKDQPQDRSFFAFPRGAGAGRCLHAILEEWDFCSDDRSALERLVRRKLKAHAINEDWTKIVASKIQSILATDLNGNGLQLSQVKASRRLAELEFTYPLRGLTVQGLQAILTGQASGLPKEFARAAETLTFETVSGFMKGFIDLSFEYQGRYYLIDWKSNWLGPTQQDYVRPRLVQAMAREHYYLQYLIYTLALHRYLGLRLPEYSYAEHFGGVYYLFLRGMDAEGASAYGIFTDRPGEDLISALDGVLA